VLLWVVIVIFIIKGAWFWVVGAILGLFYLGIIGSKLHPYQSASDLEKGSLKSEGAQVEDILISPEEQRLLVGQACTRIGLLIGVTTGTILWGLIGWSWYFALPLAFIIALFLGAILKVIFKVA
jgi:hypothetical protein